MSRASNLVVNDTNGVADVFLRDRIFQTTTRINLTSTGQEAVADSLGRSVDNVVISGNGRLIVFSTWSPNMMPGDTNNVADVDASVRRSSTLERISISTSPNQQPNMEMAVGQVSYDGRFVVFDGSSNTIIFGVFGGVFLHDRVLHTIESVSRASGPSGTPANSACCGDVSEDGRYVAFASSNAVAPEDTNGTTDVYVRDRLTTTTTRISVDSAEMQGTTINDVGLNPFSRNASMSGDGRYVAFHSPCFFDPVRDTNGLGSDIYVRDMLLGTTDLVSRNPSNISSNMGSVRPRLSNNGWFLAFESASTDYVMPDTNGSDVIRTQNCPPP
jgi:hypothetical protein